jgi:magnesium transporter
MHSVMLFRLHNRNLAKARRSLAKLSVTEAVELLRQQPAAEEIVSYRLLDEQVAKQVFPRLGLDAQGRLLRVMTAAEAGTALSCLDVAGQVRLLDGVPAEVAERAIDALPAPDRDRVRLLRSAPVGRVGRIATTRFLSVAPETSAAQALRTVRLSTLGPDEVGTMFVTDEQRHYLGLVSVPELVKADDDTRVGDIARLPEVAVAPSAKVATATRLLRQRGLGALPVVDREQRLIGSVTATAPAATRVKSWPLRVRRER